MTMTVSKQLDVSLVLSDEELDRLARRVLDIMTAPGFHHQLPNQLAMTEGNPQQEPLPPLSHFSEPPAPQKIRRKPRKYPTFQELAEIKAVLALKMFRTTVIAEAYGISPGYVTRIHRGARAADIIPAIQIPDISMERLKDLASKQQVFYYTRTRNKRG